MSEKKFLKRAKKEWKNEWKKRVNGSDHVSNDDVKYGCTFNATMSVCA